MKWVVLFTVMAVLIFLAGCASPPEPRFSRYADCTVPITRDAGMGVRVDGCAAWRIGRIR